MDGKQHIQQAYKSLLDHDFEQAINWFEQAVADEPGNASFHYSLSITYARSNKLNKAITYAEIAVQLDPEANNYRLHLDTLRARQLLVEAERLLQDASADCRAIPLLESAVRLDPLSVEARIMLALSLAKQHRHEEAEGALREALKLNPEHVEANQLFREYMKKGNR